MVLPIDFWLLFGICMLVSAIGFKNYVWFISLGYGFSIAAEGLAMLILYGQGLTAGTIICCVLFIIYGFRLSGYLAYREFKSSSYKKNMTGEIKDGKTVPFGVKIAIWVTCAALYVTQIAAVFYRLHNAPFGSINEWFAWQQNSIDTETECLTTKARLGCCGEDGFMDPNAGEGEVSMDKDLFKLLGTLHGEKIEFSVKTEKIGAFPITPGEHFDIYHNGKLIYIYPLPDVRMSVKWVCYLDNLTSKKRG